MSDPADTLAEKQNKELISSFGFAVARSATLEFVRLSMIGLASGINEVKFMEMMSRHFAELAAAMRKARDENR